MADNWAHKQECRNWMLLRNCFSKMADQKAHSCQCAFFTCRLFSPMPADERTFSSALSSIFISPGSCGAPAIDQITLQPCLLNFWHLRHPQVSGLWNILWDKLLLVFYHTAAFFLDEGDKSIPYLYFRVCEMGLKECYCKQGVKCIAATAAIPWYFTPPLHQNFLLSLTW